ncbi:MAG: response regulator transcription factor [Candidatus Obscuribacterales bacterium]|nr:response regulator transcription factor [Candidatus Obscuribacterales bacterium]
MKILIIEDDKRIARPLREELHHLNYVVDIAADGVLGLELALSGSYDLILLDIMLTGMDGYTICKTLRDSGSTTAILMLTARSLKNDKVTGLDVGADDYLTKPFELDELTARIRALTRRSPSVRKTVFDCGQLQIDTSSCSVTFDQAKIDLTPTEYRLLLHFVRNPSVTFSGEDLIDRLWSHDCVAGKEAIKTHMMTLRRKLSKAGVAKNLIETVYGFGYRLNETC